MSNTVEHITMECGAEVIEWNVAEGVMVRAHLQHGKLDRVVINSAVPIKTPMKAWNPLTIQSDEAAILLQFLPYVADKVGQQGFRGRVRRWVMGWL